MQDTTLILSRNADLYMDNSIIFDGYELTSFKNSHLNLKYVECYLDFPVQFDVVSKLRR